jgi:succinate dehydrogenase flavin-adding protein (antitoxin of CptAB toxin-antitoxin module)
MNEVVKLYEKAGIEPEKKCYYWDCSYSTGMPANDIPYAERNCQDCSNPDKAVYPPFNSEKQLELIKLIANRKDYPAYEYFGNLFDDYIQLREFDEALARLVNDLWQDLTEEEHKQVKEILE